MRPWQSYARVLVALIGLGAGWLVYSTLGTRRTPVPPAPVERLDPAAALETTGGEFQRVQNAEQEFDVTAAQSLFYKDGSVTQRDVSITARNRGGRDFVVTASQARSERDEQALQLTGDVKLAASDGFELTTDRGSFDRSTGIAQSPGEVVFMKDRLSGSGVGMTYEQATDVLRVLDRAEVTLKNVDGSVNLSFTAAHATLDRLQHVLNLEGDVRVRRGGETMSGGRAMALLSEELDSATRIELRGDARVEGGSTEAATMSANDIDLDYTEDGKVVKTVALMGAAHLDTKRDAGSEDGPAPGNKVSGDRIDLDLGPTGSLDRIRATTDVTLELPSTAGSAARTVSARALDAQGQPGQGLTAAQFDGNVRFEERAASGGGREVTSAALRLALTNEAVREATFLGRVTFRDAPLEARADEMRYRPMASSLTLRGPDPRGRPRVEDDAIAVESDAIDVGLDPRQITAKGSVKTTLRPGGRRGGRATGDQAEPPRKLPGLLKQDDVVNVNAETLAYTAANGQARYTGGATLWQGETTIRGDVIALDQANGNFTSTGSARSNLVLADGPSNGRAHEIAFDDARHTVSYIAQAPPSAPARAGGAAAPAPAATPSTPPASLTGPAGDLRARRMDVFLDAAARAAERLEASGSVATTIDTRSLTGERLIYHAKEERYEVTGRAGVPVRLVEPCRETVGRALTFFKSTDRIVVDGEGRGRTRTEGRGACPPAPTR